MTHERMTRYTITYNDDMNLVHRLGSSPTDPCDGTCDDGHHQQKYGGVLHIDPDEMPVNEKLVNKKTANAEQNSC